MTLTLNILRCPDVVPPETRRVQGGEFSIGRAPGNDWVLADPDRHLSKRHCVLAFRHGAWQLADTSTNGTFLNREPEPVGGGSPRTLRDGDRLRLGAYEIEVVLADDDSWIGGRPVTRPAASPFDDDPFADPPVRVAGPPDRRTSFPDTPSGDSVRAPIGLPSDFDPLAPEDQAPFGAPVQADHSPAIDDAFRPPRPAAGLLPDDWDLDEAPFHAAVPAPPPPIPIPTPPVSVPPVSAPSGTAGNRSVAATADDGLMAAFLAGAGLEGPAPADAEASMRALGAAFRAAVRGLRAALIARAAIKGEFRIEQTMIRARGNNPLKFSANDDDALSALLGTGRRVDMTPEAAIEDALRDIRLHELATMAAMQAAVRELVARLDPAPVRRAAEVAAVGLPSQRKARAWSAYEKLHADISGALADDFDSVFGRAFARAYEQALVEAGRGDPS